MNAQRIGIIGSGSVGQALGKGFAKAGHEVMIGTRDPSKLKDWMKEAGPKACVGTNAEAAKFGDLMVVCTKWEGTENAIALAGKENFKGKIVIDTTNPLKFVAQNQPPVPGVVYPNSCAKKIQEMLPQAHVVKCFNTVPAPHMANAQFSEGKPDMFIAGNDANAKKVVSELCQKWGWNVQDIGDVNQAYLVEGLAMLIIQRGILTNNWNQAWKLLQK